LDGTKLKPLSELSPPFLKDPSIPDSHVMDQKFDCGIGLHYLNPILSNLDMGFSITHLNHSGFSFINSNQQSINFSSTSAHYYFNASIDIPMGYSKLVLQPNLLVKYGSKYQTDFNLIFLYNQAFYAGLSFRQNDNLNLMVGLIRCNAKIGYAFDYIISELKPGTKTNHELFIQYCYPIKTKYRYLLNPRFLHDSLN
jgi:type IX secretion system PorP/SprF family membrane protein